MFIHLLTIKTLYLLTLYKETSLKYTKYYDVSYKNLTKTKFCSLYELLLVGIVICVCCIFFVWFLYRSPIIFRSTSVQPPFGLRSTSVHPPFNLRSSSVRAPFNLRSSSVRAPFELRSTSVRAPFGLRSGSVQPPFNLRSISVRESKIDRRMIEKQRENHRRQNGDVSKL